MQKYLNLLSLSLLSLACFVLQSCGPTTSSSGRGNMGGPTSAERKAQIATEPTGDFYYGRRYHVEHTRFWGYLRKPRQNPYNSKLVIMNESKKHTPDRLPEAGSGNKRYGFDQNYEYRIYGKYTGKKVYEVNSNQFLDEFLLTKYEVINKKPGWLFSPSDRFNFKSLTLRPTY